MIKESLLLMFPWAQPTELPNVNTFHGGW